MPILQKMSIRFLKRFKSQCILVKCTSAIFFVMVIIHEFKKVLYLQTNKDGTKIPFISHPYLFPGYHTTVYLYLRIEHDMYVRIGYHMSGEVISVLSLEGRYYNFHERAQRARDNYDIVTRVIQLISPRQSCDNLFITYLCLYQASKMENTGTRSECVFH